MSTKRSLAYRIIIAFTLMTAIVAGSFSIGMIIIVESSEEALLSEGMNRELSFAIHKGHLTSFQQLSAELQLYRTGGDSDLSFPPWLDDLEEGLHEIHHDNQSLAVLIRYEDSYRYALLLDEGEFESRERMNMLIATFGFILSILAALILGRLMARRVITPVIRLSKQVRHRNQLLPVAPPLARDYANDEIGHLAAAFDTTLGQLREALQRERLFTSDVSHELRTPLMIVSSSCELLLETLPPQGLEYHHVVRTLKACLEMQELVETFLWLARGATSQITHGPVLPLQQIAEEQISRWQPEAENRGLHLTLHTHETSAVTYPAPLLRSVISNLLRNALHYTSEGSVSLDLYAGHFEVIDTGPGIPESSRLSVFEPFVRGDFTKGDGLGLGLSLVQRICAQQRWSVSFTSHPSQGCTFTVRFLTP